VDDKSFKFFSSKETYCNRRYEIFMVRGFQCTCVSKYAILKVKSWIRHELRLFRKS